MRLPLVFGIILVVLGVISLAINGGKLSFALSPVLGIILLVGGILLLIFGSRAKPK